ncbi:hypothetical protein HOO54_15465 [Bacillus sp. WMMC1349]|uniref:hypothetical protein n=1 Tax=Bacillus sp. WMMC1349 TaxID=2736254 RepID=UPI0015543FA7|nr:hypothetical protein [Bacillus sp. WMMC1349]NPC93597.1 hypothetical protein [Bacillus sp. WMMC1349]
MDYPLTAPPFKMKDFEEMTKKEANEFFDWFIEEIPSRIEVLKEQTEHKIKLDYSKESLIDLFTWYLSQITVYELSEEEIQANLDDLCQYPDFVYESEKERLLKNPVELKKENYTLAMDIAIYYGEVIIKNFPQIQWTFFTKPKSQSDLNEPILCFEEKGEDNWFERNPRSLMKILIQEIKRNEATNTSLYETFLMDAEDILGENE